MLAVKPADIDTPVTTAGGPLRDGIERHPVAAFLILTYAIAWALFLPPLLGMEGIGLLPVALPPMAFILSAAILGISFPSFVVTRIAQGKVGPMPSGVATCAGG